ncbi:hypothetical protein A0H81_07429 [Grifola frondosa]|uniref:F-box domain-containing protein n=1 Tax=Grifola frondosa TaxID=5627 RepID=A0A1C7M811_GRIFR|nr:hypothetical protein A0H81_07429 [Grifola frondosa]
MSLLLLKDDILLQLITYLSPLEALHLSLTTREIYPLAILQVPTVVQCFTTAKLAKVLSYMLADIPNRARRLRDFEITRGALQIELVPLVGALFQQAVNLRRVSIDPLADFIEHDPRIGEAISALARLESLEVYEMHEDEAIAVVKQLCSSPRRLFLSDLERDDAFPLIFSILPSFTRLQHLELSSFGIEGCTSGPLTSPIYMPSVRYLRIFSSVVPWISTSIRFGNGGWRRFLPHCIAYLLCVCGSLRRPYLPSTPVAKGMSDDMRRQKLPRLFVELFPSLRYIAYACEMWDASNERLDGDDAGKRFTWWRITGSGPERKLTEISWWQGECVRWFLLNSDFESIENMDWDDGEIPDRA